MTYTGRLCLVCFSKYKVFFYAGGHGPMFDLPENQEIAKLCTKAYEGGAVVCAVCHGTVGKRARACTCTMCGYHMYIFIVPSL